MCLSLILNVIVDTIVIKSELITYICAIKVLEIGTV